MLCEGCLFFSSPKHLSSLSSLSLPFNSLRSKTYAIWCWMAKVSSIMHLLTQRLGSDYFLLHSTKKTYTLEFTLPKVRVICWVWYIVTRILCFCVKLWLSSNCSPLLRGIKHWSVKCSWLGFASSFNLIIKGIFCSWMWIPDLCMNYHTKILLVICWSKLSIEGNSTVSGSWWPRVRWSILIVI